MKLFSNKTQPKKNEIEPIKIHNSHTNIINLLYKFAFIIMLNIIVEKVLWNKPKLVSISKTKTNLMKKFLKAKKKNT